MKAGPTIVRIMGPTLARALVSSWRFREVAPDGTIGRPVMRAHGAIYLVWHAELLPQALLHRDENLAVLVSGHRDGEYLASVLSRLGFLAIRGSSTRGGAPGLLKMIRAARAGQALAITPDGPVGPARRCKPGPIHAAAATGLPIVPIGAATRRAWRIRSWDEFIVPYPGATVYVSYGEPIEVPSDVPKEDIGRWQARVDQAIDEVSALCGRTAEGVRRNR